MFSVINLKGDRRRKKKSRFDNCDACNCDIPCCDLGLFSTLLTLGALLARLVAPGRASTPLSAAAGRAPLMDRAGRAVILGYRRWLSHRWPGQCRYTPTCSAYGLAAVERYGLAVGGRLAADRLRRCRSDVPRGTHDPVR
ncbi:membrane protein insertion efficiency factor YidD [Micromonospora peucetia]|uniref:membrane protein insertion efficiency factor YidD n=1 Tax=Micromonospora peucetia TaxID=47871 RepID=UPI00225337F4|nr:membrane protein insertion efficiency factor YidD [Micromonospora peucetia]MCX4386495.1 membrane protein insertion efficiency factor YidD [Micromonospora peucetia]